VITEGKIRDVNGSAQGRILPAGRGHGPALGEDELPRPLGPR